ncbi:hypothetical protein HELRODRAFT_163867 [Helobdella robusta]|uniref:Uncharacterized protein n=1 Tax=Helobdella robusta TaxID=6412 RepID=T1EUK1_HELRO|nr:hypothetical protein HELRODRAFT_163867 [Helobdella robusta]ESN96756.1 hypothetical protein HELRODRAFT_163867 [Helobdella robusta]
MSYASKLQKLLQINAGLHQAWIYVWAKWAISQGGRFKESANFEIYFFKNLKQNKKNRKNIVTRNIGLTRKSLDQVHYNLNLDARHIVEIFSLKKKRLPETSSDFFVILVVPCYFVHFYLYSFLLFSLVPFPHYIVSDAASRDFPIVHAFLLVASAREQDMEKYEKRKRHEQLNEQQS